MTIGLACAGQHGALLELLEVPQLLDACARGGAIEEALDLRAFVARAALLHPDLQARHQLAPWNRCFVARAALLHPDLQARHQLAF